MKKLIKNWSRPIIFLACLLIVSICLIFFATTNSRLNDNPNNQAEMIALTLAWGRLAVFPVRADRISIQTEGNPFTRGFRTSFKASKTEIYNWIALSPGLQDAKIETLPNGKTKYIISPGDGANYAEVVVDFETSIVEIYVSWS